MSKGTVYLIHFERPYRHARHYLGWTTDLEARLADPRVHGDRAGNIIIEGDGARLLQVVAQAGIGWELARTWQGGRDLERQLKRQKNSSRLCPICNPTRT